MDVKTAIQTGDVPALRQLLAENPAKANELITWGNTREIRTHPLHFISDMLFDGTLERGKEIPLAVALLEAGSDCNDQAGNGETPLIGAASLGAEDIGLRLIDAGARPELRGGFKETALHWAAYLGLTRLVTRLIQAGADLNLKDERYGSPPAGWAIHGRFNSTPGKHGDHAEVVALLVNAGATVDPAWFNDEQIRTNSRMLSALRGEWVGSERTE
jgi:ankyrin repeat protein